MPKGIRNPPLNLQVLDDLKEIKRLAIKLALYWNIEKDAEHKRRDKNYGGCPCAICGTATRILAYRKGTDSQPNGGR
jgi:hypothetical protein